jgi:signal transduction histidine kinase
MKPLSLKWRVSLLVTVVLAVVITTVSTIAHIEFEESHLRNVDRTLLAMANGILASLNDNENKDILAEEVRDITSISGHGNSTLYRIWMEGSSADLLASNAPDSKYGLWLRKLAEQNGPIREQYIFANIGLKGGEYRAIWMRQNINDGVVNIVVAGSSHFTYHEMSEFLTVLLILGTSLILGSSIAVTLSVRLGLRPITVTAERLDQISRPNVGETIFDNLKVPVELYPFVQALREMLVRLDNVLQKQKQFTSDAAHELRTPLALAKSTLQAAQMQRRDTDEYERTIADALKDVARMEKLIEELLTLSRLDETNECITETSINLNELLSELTETYNEKMWSSGGKVILEESSNTTIQANSDDLIRLFSNVLDNAVRYGPSDGTIHIKLKYESDNYIAICIHDEGGNIPPEALPYLFDRFYRVDKSRSSSTGGVGLGLAIAQHIAHRYNGDISITSDPGSGTLVCIRLGRK